jgi:hypothetical protein
MAGPVRALVREYEADGTLSWLSQSIIADPKRRHQFADALGIVINPDKRMFPKSGSFFPLHAALVDRNFSDDGFGRDIWQLVSSCQKDALVVLKALLSSAGSEDGLCALGAAIGAGYEASVEHSHETPWPWLQEKASPLATEFSNWLADLVLNPVVRDQVRVRSVRLASLSRAIACAAFLTSLRAPELSTKKAKVWSELAPLFVYGGVPPGRSRDLAVRLSSRSFEAVVEAQLDSLRGLVYRRLEGARIPKQTPRGHELDAMLTVAFPGIPVSLREAAVAEIRWNEDCSKVAKQLSRAIYPPGHLESAYRTIGRMIGLAGPDRGAGAPRFLLETPMLALLVSATAEPDRAVSYENWLDTVYERFGIVLGIGEQTDAVEILQPLGFGGSLEQAVEHNHDLLRRRLVQSGLATEYSDGETEVHAPFVSRERD